jgi:enamine deaminase RidA (YjgF/YER057c/UK114 family)
VESIRQDPTARPPVRREPLDQSSSEAVIHEGTVYLALQVPEGGLETVAKQVQRVLDKIDAVLARCGTSKRKLLTATVYCADSRHFEEVHTRWDAWVPWHDPPGCQYVVAKLRAREHMVAVQVTAAL